VISTSHVNPLQRSLDEITTTNLSYAIRSISADDSNARWITNNLVLENYALANGARSLSGVYIYPQLGIWNYLDPTGNSSKLYNRYAHVLFIFDDDSKPQIIGPSADTVLVRISPCDNFFKQLNVIYFYATDPINSKCLRPRSEVVTASAATIFIYTRHN
jgi:hypothetical protein